MNIEGEEDDLEIEGVVIEEEEQPETETEISFGDEDKEVDDADLPKHLRSQITERDRQLAILKRENEELAAKNAPAPIEVGERPKLEDFDYDEDKWGEAVDSWTDDVKAAAAQPKIDPDADLQQEFQQDQAAFQAGVVGLTYDDKEQVIEDVMKALTPAQYAGIVTSGLIDPSTFMYALGKNPARLRELTGIKNHAKYLVSMARMEMKMTVGSKRKPPAAENVRQGSAATVGADKQLEKLEAKARETGDRTELRKYRQKMKAAA